MVKFLDLSLASMFILVEEYRNVEEIGDGQTNDADEHNGMSDLVDDWSYETRRNASKDNAHVQNGVSHHTPIRRRVVGDVREAPKLQRRVRSTTSGQKVAGE